MRWKQRWYISGLITRAFYRNWMEKEKQKIWKEPTYENHKNWDNVYIDSCNLNASLLTAKLWLIPTGENTSIFSVNSHNQCGNNQVFMHGYISVCLILTFFYILMFFSAPSEIRESINWRLTSLTGINQIKETYVQINCGKTFVSIGVYLFPFECHNTPASNCRCGVLSGIIWCSTIIWNGETPRFIYIEQILLFGTNLEDADRMDTCTCPPSREPRSQLVVYSSILL